MANNLCANGGKSIGSKLHIEAIQTVVPTKPTDPRQFSEIIVPQNLSSTGILQRRFHILLCYEKGGAGGDEEDSGWAVAGRIKESLGRALQDQPMLAGRLRQCDGAGDHLQIVSNDSGVRLIEARIDMKFADFVQMKEKSEAEAELVFWEDVHHNPQFSPLFYVQVTNFSCGGYSIGISCSLLLADPFLLTSFLKKWANAHNDIVSTTDAPKIPTFYLPNFGKPGTSPGLLMGFNTSKLKAESVIFTIPTNDLSNKIHNNLAESCISKAERECGQKMASNFSLFLKEDAKVEICSRSRGELLDSNITNNVNGPSGVSCARTWGELGLESVCFNEGRKPAHATCWVNSAVDEGSVMIIPSSDYVSGMKIVVTFT